MGGISTIEYGTAVTLHSAVSSLTTPTTTGGGNDVSGARRGNCGPTSWSLRFRASAPLVINVPMGLFEETDGGEVNQVGLIADGANINIPSAGVGMAFVVEGGTAKRLSVAPAVTDANPTGTTFNTGGPTLTVEAVPMWEVQQ